MSSRNCVTLSQICLATSGRKMGRDKYRKTCGSYGHLWSMVYRPTIKYKGLSFQTCMRDGCHEVRWV
jgi:hypothetical protein